MTDTPVIPGDRVRLRPLQQSDAAALHAIYSDAGAMTWWSHGPLATLDETEAKLARNLDAPDWRAWAMTLVKDDVAIGTLSAYHKRQGGVAEIGYSLVPAYWGRGLAREAVGLVIDYLFDVEGYRRICADTDPDNAASNALLTRLGFEIEGRLRAEWETHLGVRDSFIWGLLPDDRRRAA